MKTKTIALLVLLVLLVIFLIQNTGVVRLQLLLWPLSMSRALLVLFALGVGVALGWFLREYRIRKK